MNQIPAIDFGANERPLGIESPLLSVNSLVPEEVFLEGGRLIWRGFVEGASAAGAMAAFIALADAPDDDFLVFAQRFGILGLRPDGYPATAEHRPAKDGRNTPHQFDRNGETWYFEDIGMWRAYAIGMKTHIAFTHALRHDINAPTQQTISRYRLDNYRWENLGLSDDPTSQRYSTYIHMAPDTVGFNIDFSRRRGGPDAGRVWLSFATNTWIELASLTPWMIWAAGDPRMILTLGRPVYGWFPQNATFSVLVNQMAAWMTSPDIDRAAVCSRCGRLYESGVRPGRHENNYCSDVCKADGKRERNREWARRKAAERRGKAES